MILKNIKHSILNLELLIIIDKYSLIFVFMYKNYVFYIKI